VEKCICGELVVPRRPQRKTSCVKGRLETFGMPSECDKTREKSKNGTAEDIRGQMETTNGYCSIMSISSKLEAQVHWRCGEDTI